MSQAHEWAKRSRAHLDTVPHPPPGWKPDASIQSAWVEETYGEPGLRLLWAGKPAQYFTASDALSLAAWIQKTFGPVEGPSSLAEETVGDGGALSDHW